jgi:hypothetical protein
MTPTRVTVAPLAEHVPGPLLLVAFVVLVVAVTVAITGTTPTLRGVAARIWWPTRAARCPSCGWKNPGPNHECASAVRVPSWARGDR